MPIDSTHPDYQAHIDLWTLCRDSHAGQNAVKAKGLAYLPATEGMYLEGMLTGQDGLRRYQAYLRRAVFPEVMKDTVDILVGILNRKPPSIQLPEAMEPLRDKATILGESLVDLLRKIHEQQLVTGRMGLHVDVPQDPVQIPSILPLLSTYTAESVINWDDGEAGDPTKQNLNIVVLDETENVRDGLEWKTERKYRVLVLGEFAENESVGIYSSGMFMEDETFDVSATQPVLLRGQTLGEIPFVFIGPHDIDINVDLPPLLGLANRSMSIYLGEADLRHALFMTGQETLVTIGNTLTENVQIGPGARIAMQEGGDAKFIGVDSRGIQFQLNNLNEDYQIANALSARLVQRGAAVESGDALRIRVAAQTASLTSIAKASAAGMQEALRMAARWLGVDDDGVLIEPNLDFADDPMEASELNEMLTFKQRGGVISYRTMNEIMLKRDVTSRTLEEEIEEIELEEGVIPADILDKAAMSSMAPANGGFGQPFEQPGDENENDSRSNDGE